MKILYLITALMLLLSANVFAMRCPLDIKKIDAALAQGPTLSSENMARVKQLRAEGESLHKSGKHSESVKKLGEAMQILGIE
ncbi:MAG: hypothetical protein GTO41_28390 [Burkholderiales bacterium]|nr:hypothetical protein [Burkholderiales bacterium]